MKILILGAQGSLGQTFVDLYHDQHVFAWDRNELDITDEEAVKNKITELKPELIINCAAYNAVDKAEEERQIAETINGYSVGFIAAAAGSVGATMVHFSTAYVFDGNSQEGYNEDDLPRPNSAYGESKLLGEIELEKNLENYYLIRTTWLYGRATPTGKPSFVDTMLKLAKENKPIKGIDDEFGQPTFVKDLAQATRALIEQKKPFGIYHLVNSGEASWYDWAKEIFAIKGIKADLMHGKRENFDRKAQRPKFGVLKNTKFIELRPWTESLKEYLKEL